MVMSLGIWQFQLSKQDRISDPPRLDASYTISPEPTAVLEHFLCGCDLCGVSSP
jgi:hypothetical protein